MGNSKKAEDKQALEYCHNMDSMAIDVGEAIDAIKCISKILVATHFVDEVAKLPEELKFVRNDFSQAALHRGIVQLCEGTYDKIAILENHNPLEIVTGKGNA